jgi:hypothetical protein
MIAPPLITVQHVLGHGSDIASDIAGGTGLR